MDRLGSGLGAAVAATDVPPSSGVAPAAGVSAVLPKAGPHVKGSTAKAGPRNTSAAGATLEEGGTSVAATAAPKPEPGRTIQEALAQTPQQQGLGWTSL